MPGHIILIGRFPPPPDGQSMATERLYGYLSSQSQVHRINTMIPAGASAWSKLTHYRAVGRQLADALASYPEAPVIWTSISPETVGHLRDVGTVFPRLKGRRTIAVSHWGKFASVFENAATAWSARRLIPRLERVVFTTSVLSEACAAWIPQAQRRVIPNTLDAALIPERAALDERIERGPGRPFQVLFLSNMIREKGWEDVLEAAALLKNDDTRFEWTFAGGWPRPSERPLFDAAVERLGVGDCVRYEGLLQKRSEIGERHLAADLFVLPSWLREAQPLSIMEAMAAGTPCVVADDGGMPDMIGSGGDSAAGLVVSARKPSALADAVRSLATPEAWHTAAVNARQQFEERFAPDVVDGAWDALITEVMRP